MRVDAAPRAAQIKRIPEEGSTGRFFEIERWPSKEDAITMWGGEGQHKDMRRLDAFLLHAGRSDVHLVSNSNANTSAGSRHPTQVIEAPTELRDEVGGLGDP